MKKRNKFQSKCKHLMKASLLSTLLLSPLTFAQTIHVQPNTVISTSTKFDNVTLDMTNGSFIINNHANLTIENSVINGKVSDSNRILISVQDGSLKMNKNEVSIHSVGIDPHPLTQSLDYVISVNFGTVALSDNHFAIAEPMTAGLLITSAETPTTNFRITHNVFERFHGVLYLVSSDHALVKDNTFIKNTYGHIVVIGNDSDIIHNTIYFSGNNHLGNSIDLINANNINVARNVLLTPTCHGIYIINSHNLNIHDNRVAGGITHAINVYSYPESASKLDGYAVDLIKSLPHSNAMPNLSSDVTIKHNYFAQNRYGIAASDVVSLNISDNYFVQRFADNDARKFWTDNSILLANIKKLSWTNNFYKEAFTQDISGDNSKSFKFVPFPVTGGVSL